MHEGVRCVPSAVLLCFTDLVESQSQAALNLNGATNIRAHGKVTLSMRNHLQVPRIMQYILRKLKTACKHFVSTPACSLMKVHATSKLWDLVSSTRLKYADKAGGHGLMIAKR